MAIDTDFQIQNDKDIRYVGTGDTYSVLELHQWAQSKAAAAESTGDDAMDITVQTPTNKSFDTIINLINGFNIDDYTARFLYDGSILQNSGADIWDGFSVLAPAGTSLEVIQNGAPITPNYWGTGYNADAAAGISHKFMVKVRSGGADIDGRRLIFQTRKWGFQFSEFRFATGSSRGINVAALAANSDGNNATTESTVEGYTSITNTEGYRLIDINDDAADEPYYSEWNRDTYTINQLYERAKWLSAEPRIEDSNADTGSDFAVGNGTIDGQAQSFVVGANNGFLMNAKVQLKKVGAPTGTAVAVLYAHSGSFGTSSVPTGAALATSAPVIVSDLSTSYATVEFGFATPFEMVAGTNYVIAIEYTGGDGSNYVHVRGLATSGTHAGNRAEDTGSWAAAATDDLNFSAYSVGVLYGYPGNMFRGVTHQIPLTTPRSGTFDPFEIVTWTGGTGLMVAIDDDTTGTKMWIQLLTGTAPGAAVLITGSSSGATTTTSGVATERDTPLKSATPFIGSSTGSALVGAYGVGVEFADLTAADKLIDLDNVQRTPPNNVTFTVGGLVSGEDYLIVAINNSGDIDFDQFTLNGALTGGAVTSVVVNGSIPADTPASGTIRIQRANGVYTRHPYSSWSGSTFTITSHDFSTNNAANGANCFVSYIDKLAASTSESFIVTYLTDRTLFIRVRDGGGTPIKTFETTATLGVSGGSATANRTSDA